jgi:DNA-binding transcriptional regulator GbsR (MarR family)
MASSADSSSERAPSPDESSVPPSASNGPAGASQDVASRDGASRDGASREEAARHGADDEPAENGTPARRRRKLQFAEVVGRIMEDSGKPRIAGRILGWLMVCTPPYQSFDDLVEVLDVSKGSVSTMTRNMIDAGLVKRTTIPGDRKSYYQVRRGAWTQVLENRIELARRFTEAAETGVEIMEAEPEENQWRIKEMHAFMDFVLETFKQALEAYEPTHREIIPPMEE